eukprot:Em0452g6a
MVAAVLNPKGWLAFALIHQNPLTSSSQTNGKNGGEVLNNLESLQASPVKRRPKDRKEYKLVLGKFDEFFKVRKYVIFNRARFSRRNQLEGESSEQYVTVLHSLAENCNNGNLKHEMIRNRIVVGIRDSALSERLQLDPVSRSAGILKLDANSGFWQIPLSEDSRLLTTFVTPFGRYCFNKLPFGISFAPEHFQKVMSRILEGLDRVVCQMDECLYLDTPRRDTIIIYKTHCLVLQLLN